MSDRKSPLDRALDLFVYGPIGFALEARRVLPGMVEKGRQQVNGQLTMARMMGQFAVQQGQKEAGKAVASAQKQATSTLRDLGVLPHEPPARGSTADGDGARPAPSPVSPPPSAPATTPTASTPASPPTAPPPTVPSPTVPPPAAPAAPTAPVASAASTAPSTEDAAPPVPSGASAKPPDLAIPDYDSLSASQVVPRLAGLSSDELEAVRSYEATHRGRKTILNRVAQLQVG